MGSPFKCGGRSGPENAKATRGKSEATTVEGLHGFGMKGISRHRLQGGSARPAWARKADKLAVRHGGRLSS
ncbi:MAG: hypothetical protein ACYDBP_02615 [Leptospirales bacterium]